MRVLALLLGLALAAPAPAGPGKAELERRYREVLSAMGAHNKAGAEAGTTGTSAHRARMMELIGEMQRLQLAIAEAGQAGRPSPWEGWDSAALDRERKRLQREAEEATKRGDSAAATALYQKVREVAEAYNLKVLRSTSGRTAGGQGAAGHVTLVDAMRFFEEGDVERGINAYEAVIADGLDRDNLAAAVNLAGFYLDLVADAERSEELARRAEARCVRALAEPDLAAADRRLYVQYRRGARQTLARALAASGQAGALRELVRESGELLEEETGETANLADAIFRVAGLFQVATGHLVAADLAEARGKAEEVEAARAAALARLDAMAGILDGRAERDAFDVQNWTNITRFRRAALLQDLGRTAEALVEWRRYFESETAYAENARSGHYYAMAKVGHARSLAAAGRVPEAVAAAEAARLRFFGPDPRRQVMGPYQALSWKPDFALGELHRDAGNPDAALRHFGKALEIIEGLYAKMRSGTLKGSFLSFDECGAAYDHMVSIHLEKGDPGAALAVLERSKSAVLLDMLRSQPLRERGRWPRKLLERERELKRRMRELRPEEGAPTSGTRAAGGADPAARRKVLQDYELFLREVGRHDASAADPPPARRVDRVWAHGAAALAKAASGGRVVVAYFDDGTELRAFVLREGAVEVFPAGATRAVSRAAARLRRNVTARSRRWAKPAGKLYEALVKPWEAKLEGARELVIVPTGELFALPFAALPDASGKALGARVPMSFVSQLSLLVEATSAAPAAGPALVVADPDGSLPHARVEGAEVAAAAGGKAKVLEGGAATEGAVKGRVGFLREAPPPGTLHLATHGLLDKGAHLRSSLVLAPDEVEDGKLTFLEVFSDLDLRATPVVILSACNTAIGETRGGDEVAGLARAFQYAGAAWVVASLWEVSDEASARLMAALHRELARGEPVDRALRAAQAATRAASPEWEHPYFWAAFAAYRR